MNLLLDNLNNFTQEHLYQFYLSLQQLVLVREVLFSVLTDLINSPYIQLLQGPILDRLEEIHESLRLGGNDLMSLVRNIENILNIPEQERVPQL